MAVVPQVEGSIDITASPTDVTIPSATTAVYFFWNYWANTNGDGLSSVTLESESPHATSLEQFTSTGGNSASGVVAWYNPDTGADQTLSFSFDTTPAEGPVCALVYVSGGKTSEAWRDGKLDQDTSTNAVSVTLTTTDEDLVLKFDQRYSGSVPPLSSPGWTDVEQTVNNSEASRVSSADAPGASTTVCDSEGENYSTITAISIAGDSGTTYKNMSASPSATLTVTEADLGRVRSLTASPSATGATNTPVLTQLRNMSASATAAATSTPTLNRDAALVATSTATATGDATLQVPASFAGESSATATANATLNRDAALNTAVTATATGSSTLNRDAALAGIVFTLASASAILSGGEAVPSGGAAITRRRRRDE